MPALHPTPLIVLAFDSSTDGLSIALDLGTGSVISRREAGGARTSQRLLPLVRDVLAEAGVGLRDVGLIGFGAGPGAFTGLRAACAAAQGLGFGLGLQVVPINTLLAVAAGASASGGTILVANDARMGELYWAIVEHDADGNPRLRGSVQVAPPGTAAASWVKLLGDPPSEPMLALFGNAWAEHGGALASALPAAWGPLLRAARLAPPDAAGIARLARAAHARGEGVPPAQAQPFYVRNKVALTIEERARGGASA